MSVTTERIDPTDPVAVDLASAMLDELISIYGPGNREGAPTALPHELADFVLVREDGRVVAGGALKPLTEDIVEIKRMYVLPDARSRGHARRLLVALEEQAIASGWPRVRLDTGPEQRHAQALYESAGYRTIPDYNANPYAAYWGEKDLPAVIPERFNGPPGSGHGGYSAWVASRYVDGPCEVTLKAPPPLDVPLPPTRDGDVVRLGDALEARASTEGIPEVHGVSIDVAREAAARSTWREGHPFPTCFACGPDRPAQDPGLRLFPGATGERRFAVDWTPGEVSTAMVWAALDCPTAAPVANPPGPDFKPCVLARFSVEVDRLPVAGEPHAIVAEAVGVEGRKRTALAALFSSSGECLARSRALWIELR